MRSKNRREHSSSAIRQERRPREGQVRSLSSASATDPLPLFSLARRHKWLRKQKAIVRCADRTYCSCACAPFLRAPFSLALSSSRHSLAACIATHSFDSLLCRGASHCPIGLPSCSLFLPLLPTRQQYSIHIEASCERKDRGLLFSICYCFRLFSFKQLARPTVILAYFHSIYFRL